MQIIPTTKTKVEKLCARARDIQRTENIAYAEAQDRAAQEGGYEHWRHVAQSLKATKSQVPAVSTVSKDDDCASDRRSYMGFLKAKGTAIVTPLPLPSKGDVFHAVDIEGYRFESFIADGLLYVFRRRMAKELWFNPYGSVTLGAAVIREAKTRRDSSGLEYWAICKYGPMEPCVDIDGLSKQGRLALAHEFGIPSWIDLAKEVGDWHQAFKMSRPSVAERLFFLSPAFEALTRWCKAHPRKSRAMKCLPHYLGDWKSASIAGRWPLEDDSDVSDEELKRLLYEIP